MLLYWLNLSLNRPISKPKISVEEERDLRILAEIVVDPFLESQKAKRRAMIEQHAPPPESAG